MEKFKRIAFGKTTGGYYRIKAAEIDIEMRLYDELIYDTKTKVYRNTGNVTFSVCGNLWNSQHTDILMCGQCLDALQEYVKVNRKQFDTIHRLWKSYHLKHLSDIPTDDANLIMSFFDK